MAKPTKTSLPVYDDFGNHIGIPPNKRTYERQQGCWNCIAFECSELYRRRVEDCHRRDVKAYLARGFGLHAAGAKASATKQMLLDKAGIFGMCLKGKVPGDFVGCKHLCVDGWSGKVGVMGSLTPGQPLNEPVAALYDDHGHKITDDGDLVDPAPDPKAVAEHKAKIAAQAGVATARQAEPIVLQSKHPVVEEQWIDVKVPQPVVFTSSPAATADISEEKLTFVPLRTTLPEPIVAKFSAADVARDVVTPVAEPAAAEASSTSPTLVVHTDKPFEIGKLVPEVAVQSDPFEVEEEGTDVGE